MRNCPFANVKYISYVIYTKTQNLGFFVFISLVQKSETLLYKYDRIIARYRNRTNV